MKKIISFMLIIALVGTIVFSVMAGNGETWETWDAGDANIALRFDNGTTGEYTLGDYFELKASTYASESKGILGNRLFQIDAYEDYDREAIKDVQYKDGETWKDISEFNVEISFKNDLNRYFRARFTKDGIYTINFKFTASDDSMGVACVTRYLTIDKGTFTVGKTPKPIVPETTTLEEGVYDVSVYKSGETYTYPQKEGQIFAGWFTDDTYTTPYLENTGTAYAKFIDENVLKTKCQWNSSNTAVRFISSLDSLDYAGAGIIFNGTYGGGTITNKTRQIRKLYRYIRADDELVSPSIFSKDSRYFLTYTVRDMDAGLGSTWHITPYLITLDGTTVTGVTGNFSYTPES